jgi:integrase
MPKLNLTERAIARMAAPDPSGKQVLHWDTAITGLAVLCSGVSPAKTYVVQRALRDGRTRRITIGAVSILTLEKARARAADAIDEMRRGIDPKRKIDNPTLRSALESYLAARKDLRPASIKTYRQVEKYLARWMDWQMRDITAERVEDRHRALADEVGPATANSTMRTLRVLWNFAAERTPDLPPNNPVRRLRRQWYPQHPTERIVRTEELPKFFAAVNAMENPVARDYVLLMLFTGMRRTEAATLKWTDIDLGERVIRVPAASTKAGRKLDLPMSDFVRDMLVARRAIGDAKFVFPAARGGHVNNPHHLLKPVIDATGIELSAHDLRRTFITVAESADISPMALKALVNHSLGKDVTAGYVQMTAERLREPAQRVCDKMKSLCRIAPIAAANVARL